ncbi:MAG: GAF domain-containing protein [Microcella sp.]|uniref:GAF domain-containing sensor histidine kinase n=1 Tax=Microcella sp. TaxID=1913979 RepID=UPI00331620B7
MTSSSRRPPLTSPTTSVAIEALVRRVLDRASSPEEGHHRLAVLLSAAGSVTQELDLTAALQRIVEVARELVGARYGALGVIAPDGGLERFLHDGFTLEQVAALGPPPSGKGILGAVISERKSIRLDRLADDARSVGFPAHHPPMGSFLGVPIPVGDAVFGNLYLTERADGPFDDVDEAVIASLAAMAGTAIANSRQYEQSRDDRRWLAASERLNQRLLAGELGPDDLTAVTDVVSELTGTATVVAIDSSDDAHEHARTELLRRAAGSPVGPVLIVPLEGGPDGEPGALAVARGERGHPFTAAERETITRFARSVAIARELARIRSDEERIALADERDRIARDLHDHVIQSLFAVGLSLQSVVGDPRTPVGGRLAAQVEAIDATIRQIRHAIYRLDSPAGASDYSLRTRITTLVRQTLEGEELDSRLEFSGPVDTLVDTELGDEVAAVVRESLSNAVRHARASRVAVSIAVRGAQVTVTVADDGVGIAAHSRRSGLDNLAARARQRAGEFAVTGADPHGTVVSWTVPWEAR